MKKILVLSDTHIPKTTGDLPPAIYDAIAQVDLILHAGDFVDTMVIDKLKALKPLKAVCGNMDSMGVRALLNPKEVIEVEKVKIGLIHGYGAPVDLIETVRKEFTDVQAIVFGHSHAPTNIVKGNILFFNPGSPTDKVFAAYNSYGILTVEDKKVKGEIIRL